MNHMAFLSVKRPFLGPCSKEIKRESQKGWGPLKQEKPIFPLGRMLLFVPPRNSPFEKDRPFEKGPICLLLTGALGGRLPTCWKTASIVPYTPLFKSRSKKLRGPYGFHFFNMDSFKKYIASLWCPITCSPWFPSGIQDTMNSLWFPLSIYFYGEEGMWALPFCLLMSGTLLADFHLHKRA